jgi:hypothetical protein
MEILQGDHGFIFASRAGNLHSYNSNSFWASSSVVWSEVRPHTVQNHSCVCGFHLIVLCSTSQRYRKGSEKTSPQKW